MLTSFEKLITGITLTLFILWMTGSFWRRLLPHWFVASSQTVGLFIAVPVCVGFGGGGGVGGVVNTSAVSSDGLGGDHHANRVIQHRAQQFVHVPPPKPQKATKRNVSETLKKVVAARQQWLCDNCSRILPPHFEVDHIISLADGGSNDASNLRALCRDCHGWKSTKDRLRWNGEL